MGTSDGTVQGLVALLEPEPSSEQCNIVLVGDGFTAAEQASFRDLCDDFVALLQAEPWFSVAGGAINLYRLDVESDQSGADDPTACGGDGTTVDTYFDSQFCNGNPPIRRCLSGDESLVRDELDAALPDWHAAAVLVNTTKFGGCASGNVFFTNIGSGWENTVLHELGHAAFGLADEYDLWSDCADENPRTTSTEPNVSRSASAATLKWRHLRTPGVPIPTQLNPDCSLCNTAPNVLSDDNAIGMYEGARYEHCDMFRPAYTCRMRSSAQPFCRVCVEAIVVDLGAFSDANPLLEVTPTTLNFGEVATDLTLFLPIEIRNVRSGHPMPMDIVVNAPTGAFFIPQDQETAFTLPAPVFEAASTKQVFVAYTAGAAGTTATGDVTIDSADGQSVTVSLSGVAVQPPPVDTVLVVDNSGSMNDSTGVPGQTKRDHAIEAGELYVTLLKPTDQIGIVRYATSSGASDILLNMRTAGDLETGTGRAAARQALDPANLAPSGSTSIGAGIINGSDLLDDGVADARALLVLTDGLQNTPPNVAAGQTHVQSKSPTQRVFAVGLGLNQLQDTLNQIATVTGGLAQITGDLVDEREFLLQKLYVQILSDVSDEAFVRDPVDRLRFGNRRATPIHLAEIDVACDFIVTWRGSQEFPKYMNIWLEAPDGTLIERNSGLPGVDYVERSAHAFYRVRFPFDPAKPQGHVGTWRVWVEVIEAAAQFQSTLIYSVMAKARSNLLVRGRVMQTEYAPGSPMRVVLEPRLFGQPVALDPPVQAIVTRPDGVKRTVSLIPNDDLVYSGVFTDTPLVGPYRVDCEVTASSPQGRPVTRYRTMTGVIFIPGSGNGGTNGDQSGGDDGSGPDGHSGNCDEARRALRILAKFVEECCEQRKIDKIDIDALRKATLALARGKAEPD